MKIGGVDHLPPDSEGGLLYAFAMQEFCTIFDVHFALRGLTLAKSLRLQETGNRLWILCTDDAVFRLVEKLQWPCVIPVSLPTLENTFHELALVKSTRSAHEYITTLKGFLMCYVLDHSSPGSVCTFLDADLYFFGDPNVILSEMGNADLLLIPHRLPLSLRNREAQNGIYNSGFLAVRHSADGRKAAKWWADRCREWCYDRVENGKFIDQKYLEELPHLFPNTAISQHPGLNLAPWNIGSHHLSANGTRVRVDGKDLIFYHFHALKELYTWLYDLSLARYHAQGSSTLIRHVYGAYFQALKETQRELSQQGFEPSMGTARKNMTTGPISLGLMFSRLRKRQWMLKLL